MIIIGYQGIGKSSLSGRHDCIDLESSNFYVDGKKPDNWYVMYCNVAFDLSRQGYIVFTASHQPVRDYFGEHNETNQKICTCHPSVALKDEWINKLYERYFIDRTEKNLRALRNAQERYVDNIHEIMDAAVKYGFIDIEIPSMDYSLEDLIMNEARWCLHCNYCGKNICLDRNDYYMLKDELWMKICDNDYIDSSYILCRKCGEKFLGRKFTKDDLKDVPLNMNLDW